MEQNNCEKWERTQRFLTHVADEFEKKGYYIERNLLNLPKRYADTTISYMNQCTSWITLKNDVEALEKDLEKVKGYLFDFMNQLDEIESSLSKEVRAQ